MGSTSAVEVEGAVDTFRFVVLSVRRRLSLSLSLSQFLGRRFRRLLSFSLLLFSSFFFFLSLLSFLFFLLLQAALLTSLFFFVGVSTRLHTSSVSTHRRDRVDRLSTNDF